MTATLANRTALVTGAAGDIGRAIAGALAEAGADVAVHDRRAGSSLSAVAADVQAYGRRAVAVAGDVRDPEAVAAFVDKAIAALGKLDILVNNAGVMTEIPMLDLSLDDWRETIDTNLTGYFLCTRAVARHMIGRRSGSIINIASQLAYRGGIGLTHYSAAKAGVLGFTRAAARELAEHAIRVNAVAPGPVETQLVAPYKTADWVEAKLATSVLKRLGRPDEVAGSVVFLASDSASLYFGQTLSPNGGGVMP
jgi:3-oxoacyl-[acyl-carrier protein] reductase